MEEQRAFTRKAEGLVREIRTEAGIFEVASSQISVPNNFEKFNAIWDTGATNTAIASTVVNKLKLTRVTFAKVGTAGGEINAPVYLVNIILPNNVIIPNIQVTELKDLNNCDVLVGMDIISQGDFAITHLDGKACFSFRMPPSRHVDFVPESNEHNRRLTLNRLKTNQSKKNLPKRKFRKKR